MTNSSNTSTKPTPKPYPSSKPTTKPSSQNCWLSCWCCQATSTPSPGSISTRSSPSPCWSSCSRPPPRLTPTSPPPLLPLLCWRILCARWVTWKLWVGWWGRWWTCWAGTKRMSWKIPWSLGILASCLAFCSGAMAIHWSIPSKEAKVSNKSSKSTENTNKLWAV